MPKADGQFGCARCKVPLEGPAKPKPSDRFTCPVCGTGDSLKNVEGEVLQQMQEQVASKVFSGTRDSKYVKVERKRSPKRVYRFVILPS